MAMTIENNKTYERKFSGSTITIIAGIISIII